MNPHRRLCSLIRNTPPASAPHFLRGALFHLQLLPEPDRKGHPPPRPYVFYFPFLPPIGVAAMSTSPHNITLCCKPHHFLLHAKSLPGPTLRAPRKPEAGFRPLPSQVNINDKALSRATGWLEKMPHVAFASLKSEWNISRTCRLVGWHGCFLCIVREVMELLPHDFLGVMGRYGLAVQCSN